jgi:hypothetical protein
MLEAHRRFEQSDPVSSNDPLPFFCECGCMTPAEMTAAEYEARGGALLDGHPAPG